MYVSSVCDFILHGTIQCNMYVYDCICKCMHCTPIN